MFFVLAFAALASATESPIFKGGFLDGWDLDEISEKLCNGL